MPCIEKDLLKINLFVLLSTPLFYSGSKLLVGRNDHSSRARYPGMQNQVGVRKHHYEQS